MASLMQRIFGHKYHRVIWLSYWFNISTFIITISTICAIFASITETLKQNEYTKFIVACVIINIIQISIYGWENYCKDEATCKYGIEHEEVLIISNIFIFSALPSFCLTATYIAFCVHNKGDFYTETGLSSESIPSMMFYILTLFFHIINCCIISLSCFIPYIMWFCDHSTTNDVQHIFIENHTIKLKEICDNCYGAKATKIINQRFLCDQCIAVPIV